MNKERRKKIHIITRELNKDNAKEMLYLLEEVNDDENYAFDSMPENLQYSMRGEESQECIDTMEYAIVMLQDIIDGNDEYEIKDVINELRSI